MKHIITTALMTVVSAAAAWAGTTFEMIPPRNAVAGQRYQIGYVLRTDDQSVAQSLSYGDHPQIDGMQFYAGPGVSTGFESGYSSQSGSYQAYTVQLVYTYIAQREGAATIPAYTVTAGGRTYRTKPASIKILPAGQQRDPYAGSGRQPASTSQGGYQRQPAPEQVLGSSVGQTTAKDLMVIITFSRKNVYEMEPVVADIKLCLRQDRGFDIGNQFNSVTLPEFDGFISEDLPAPQKSEIENIGGQNYETLVLRRYLLYPQKAGQLRVSSGQYSIDIIEYDIVSRGFRQTRREVPRKMNTATNTVTLNVKPLPEPRPAGFSGAVGHFSVTAAVEPEIVRTNESATYTLTVKGSGNIKYLKAPELTFPSTFETYTAKTDINARFDGSNYSGTFRADYPFVPAEVGKFDIAPYQFIYFNPTSGKYETATASGFNLNVLRGNAAAVVAGKEVNTEMTDILHIHPTPAFVTLPASPVFGRWWYWMVYVACFGALAASVIVYRRHIRLEADVEGRRRIRAASMAAKRFKAAKACLRDRKPEEFYTEVARALKGYVADKLGIAPSALISDTIADRLEARGVPVDDVQSVISVLNDCEMARFTPSGSDEAMTDMLARATAAVNAIEKLKS